MVRKSWYRTKEENGMVKCEVPDLQVFRGIILFEDEEDWHQGHQVIDIFHIPGNPEDIIIEHIPEWTPVANSNMFRYKMMKWRIKPEKDETVHM